MHGGENGETRAIPIKIKRRLKGRKAKAVDLIKANGNDQHNFLDGELK